MTRPTITGMLLWAAVAAVSAGALRAEPAKEAPASEAAPAAEAGEFHLDLGDVKDLREADIVLPPIDDLPARPAEAGGQEPPVKPEAAPAEQPQAPEADADRVIENPQEVVDRIIEHMGRSAGLLTREKDPGDTTQQVQRRIVEDLSDLIEYVKQQQAQCNPSQQQQKQQSQRDSQAQQRQQSQPQNSSQQQSQQQQPQPRRGQQAMRDELATRGSVQEAELAEVNKLLEQRWGDLLPNEAGQTRQGIQEMILPKYRDLLSRYFYVLARPESEQRGE